MINIYSITEIVEASNKILQRDNKKKVSEINKNKHSSYSSSIKKNTPYLLTDVVEAKEDKPELEKVSENIKTQKKIKYRQKSNEDDQYILKIYNELKKKIKKNSLKLIFDQQAEINKLHEKNNDLKETNKITLNQQKVLNQKLNKLKNLNDVLVAESETLNKQIKNINDKQINSELEIEVLKKDKIELENQIDKLTEQKKNLVNEKDLINKQLVDIMTKQNNSESQIKQLNKEKVELENKIDEYHIQNENNKQKIYDISDIENKNKFFQEENLRIGSELLEIKKKHDILKNEIEKYENQKSNLISKINSVNEALSDTNILTNVFENKVQNKVNIIDHNKIETEVSKNLDEKIKNIFSKKD